MTLAEVTRALRQLRVSGMAATLEPRIVRRSPITGRRSISSPRSSRTSCSDDRIASSSAA